MEIQTTANQPDSGPSFNPFWLWADLRMRAAETVFASTQNITDGADRVTRAVAIANPTETAAAPSAMNQGANASAASFSGIGTLHRLMWESMTQNWMRWASTVGHLLSAGAGVEVARNFAGQENPLEAVRDNLRAASWSEKPATQKELGALEYPAQRRGKRSARMSVHAFAADEPKPRRRAAAKPRRTQRSSRK